MPNRVEFREARFDDYEGIAALESSQGLATKPFEEWRRLWRDNPCFEQLGGRWPIGWVLIDSGHVVGCLSNIPLSYTFRGRPLLVAAGRGWAVEDQYRSYSPLLMDEYFNQENVDIFLNNTVNGKAAKAFDLFGSSRVPVGDWASAAFLITRHRGFAESALRIQEVPQPRLLSYPAGLALSVKDAFTSRRIPRPEIQVGFAQEFDARFDPFWARLRDQSSTLLALRSRAVLKWHLHASTWILTAGTEDALEAYAIFERRDEPRYSLKRLRLIDFQALENQNEYCAAFLRAAYDECRKQGIHVLEQIGCGLPKTKIFEEAAPYRRKLPSWCFFYMAKDPALAEQLSRADAWAPSSYDGDANL